ncbi:MAG TPA: outer membrane beta-barrel protein [Steroidobacteraceae bacterium]|nr:outer membrane beta-barrel protein [Steroidobacteraceae bacterium]
MKKIPILLLVIFSLAFAGAAEAAKGKRRSRNANRIGPYGTALVGMTSYSGDATQDEADLIDLITDSGFPSQDVSSSTDDSDFGYQAAFGYRFMRYVSAELGLVQYGSLKSTATGDIDAGDGAGFVPVSVNLAFNVGGPMISAVGILPIGDRFELYGRAGFLFASVEREFTSRVGGERGVRGSARGDDQLPVYAAGFSWNINQVYSIRAEYQVINDIGEESRTGTEDLNTASLGIIVRF